MATQRRTPKSSTPSVPPATTLEGREDQLVAAAVALAEKQIRDGTASSQIITHYLKMSSTREKLEQERLAGENVLLRAKAAQMESVKKVEELYGKALDAMRAYQGQPPLDMGDEDDY